MNQTLHDTRGGSIRLVGAVLAEQTDEWAEGRRYLGLDILTRCRLTTITTNEEVTDPLAITAQEGTPLHHSKRLNHW